MSKKTLALILTLLFLTIVLVVLALSNNKPAQNTDQNAVKKNELPSETDIQGSTILSMSPNPLTIKSASSTATVNVDINTYGDTVSIVQLEIAYNPQVLLDMKITPGTFFDSPIVLPVGGVNTSTGRISFQVAPGNLQSVKAGAGTVAVLSFRPAYQAGVLSTPITILDKSLVNGRRGTQPVIKSLLKSMSGTNILFATPRVAQPSSTNSAL